MTSTESPVELARERVGAFADRVKAIREKLHQVVVGQDTTIDLLLTCALTGSHALLVGVPGLAKTLMVKALASAFDWKFARIQFTPDLMPSDVTGYELLNRDAHAGTQDMVFRPGPVFANLVLADEINRAAPKTQSALLEAMAERHVTVGGKTHDLEDPFLVVATQNPIEQEGTYPLPEAQLDRFMLNVLVPYPTADEELEILRRTTGDESPAPAVALAAEQIVAQQRLVRRLPVPDHVFLYARDLVRASRPNEPEASALVKKCISWGAGPRAGQSLIVCAKARAALQGRYHVAIDDIRQIARPVLRHRIVTTFHAEAEGIGPEAVIEHLLGEVAAPPERAARGLVGTG